MFNPYEDKPISFLEDILDFLQELFLYLLEPGCFFFFLIILIVAILVIGG